MTLVRRHPDLDDWYAEGDESVALVGERVFALTAVASAVVGMVTDEWVPVDTLIPGLVERFGEPPGGAEGLTLQVVTTLHASGVLDVQQGTEE